MPNNNQLRNQHLLWRAGFGPLAENCNQLGQVSQKSLFKTILKASSARPAYLEVANNMFNGLFMGVDEVSKMQRKELSAAEKKQFRKQSQEDIKSLNLAWLNEMVNSSSQLREKISLFWHGHFASRNLNIYYQQLLLDAIRTNALGNFSDLLREVSKSAAMINFLNNNQNRKDHPNENFAREVMELFTLGRGHYSELDIKEAARAFSGWGADLRGDFVFRRSQHDEGVKTILGKTGRFDGDDVLNILLDQKQTSTFICRKIYRYFVNEMVNESHVSWLADRFYHSGYDIKQLMEDIFTADWFFDDGNIGCRIKSPVELLVGIRRTLPMDIENPEVQLLLQRLLGQLLFYPPNVAGWPGGTNWIDSSSLMLRLRIPQIIFASDELQMNPKADDDQMMGMQESDQPVRRIKGLGKVNEGQMIRAEIHWVPWLKNFESVPTGDLSSQIASLLLQSRPGISAKTMESYAHAGEREEYIRSMTIQWMSTPEYQLC
ncbi:MAG: DUF1800 family protein [Chitinophagales bacterium]